MGIISRLFGFRWSLYIFHDGNGLMYAMHENSVFRILGYVISYYKDNKKPIKPWSLYLNFNHNNKAFQLLPEHFTLDGENFTPLLIQQIKEIDAKYKVRGGEPVFVEVATKKKLKISEYDFMEMDIQRYKDNLQARIDNINKSHEVTFFRIMDDVFGIL